MNKQKIAVLVQTGFGMLIILSEFTWMFDIDKIWAIFFLIPFIICFLNDMNNIFTLSHSSSLNEPCLR